MLNAEKMEQVMELVNQHIAITQKARRWGALMNSGIHAYLSHHDEDFGWETHWTRLHRLQEYIARRMNECLVQEQAIQNKIAMICKEGA